MLIREEGILINVILETKWTDTGIPINITVAMTVLTMLSVCTILITGAVSVSVIILFRKISTLFVQINYLVLLTANHLLLKINFI